MSRFDHAKTNMQQRIANEGWQNTYPRFSSDPGNSWTSNHSRKCVRGWLMIYLKKHRNRTLPWIMFYDPGYIIAFLYFQDVFFKPLLRDFPTDYQIELANQLEVLANRAQHTLPPKPFDELVVIADINGVFERIEPVKKGHFPKKRLNKGSKIVQRISELDIALPYGYEEPELGMKRMARCLRKIYLAIDFEASACERWVSAACHFNLSACASHKSLIISAKDRKALKAKYIKSLRQ